MYSFSYTFFLSEPEKKTSIIGKPEQYSFIYFFYQHEVYNSVSLCTGVAYETNVSNTNLYTISTTYRFSFKSW